jgi:hypothetical protein
MLNAEAAEKYKGLNPGFISTPKHHGLNLFLTQRPLRNAGGIKFSCYLGVYCVL